MSIYRMHLWKTPSDGKRGAGGKPVAGGEPCAGGERAGGEPGSDIRRGAGDRSGTGEKPGQGGKRSAGNQSTLSAVAIALTVAVVAAGCGTSTQSAPLATPPVHAMAEDKRRSCDNPIPRSEAESLALEPRYFFRGQLEPQRVVSIRFVDPAAGARAGRYCYWVIDVAGDGRFWAPLSEPGYQITGAAITLDAVTGKERDVTYRELAMPNVAPTVAPPRTDGP